MLVDVLVAAVVLEICGAIGVFVVDSSIDGARGLDVGWLVAVDGMWIWKYDAKLDEVCDSCTGTGWNGVEWDASFSKHDLLNIQSKSG